MPQPKTAAIITIVSVIANMHVAAIHISKSDSEALAVASYTFGVLVICKRFC